MHNVKRVDNLRALLAEEKVLALELEEQFKHETMKKKALRVAHQIDEIERMFLGENIDSGMPEHIEAIHLDSIERAIHLFIVEPRIKLQKILEENGDTVMLVYR